MSGWVVEQMSSNQPSLEHHTYRTILVIPLPLSNQKHSTEG